MGRRKKIEDAPPARKLKDWIDGYLELTEGTEPPKMFRLWTAISVVASALQRKCKIVRGFQQFFPNMYIVLLGKPAARKGVALGQGYYFMEQIGIDISSDSGSKAALIRRIKSAYKKLLTKDGKELAHSSLTIYSAEFTVLIGYKDTTFLTNLVDWYDCGKGKDGIWENDTILRGSEKIYGIWVNILGATTPETLIESLPSIGIGGGFVSRVIFVNEKKNGKRKALKDFTPAQLELSEKLVEDLRMINDMIGEFSFDPICQEKFDHWYETSCEEEVLLNHNKFEGYIGRRAAHCYKLMMICSASRSDEMVIREEDFARALRLLTEIESKMDQTFKGFGKLDYSEELGKIQSWLEEKGEITRREIFKEFSNDASDKVLDSIIGTLKVMGVATTTVRGKDIVVKFNKGVKEK